MSSTPFFEDPQEQSIVKTTIVAKYFWAWARVIMSSIQDPQGRIAYVDLFSGPGRYEDSTNSTPLLILESAILDEKLRRMLVTVFNDKDVNSVRALKEAIQELPGIDTLHHYPQIYDEDVGEEIVRQFEATKLIPTLLFVDPWGYKGLSLRLINSVLKDWGCDCIFFFNFNRINMGINNPYVEEHMNALFGEEHANELRVQLRSVESHQHELIIVEELSKALQQGQRYVLPFRFRNAAGTRTSHHLIFVSKHVKGYEIMKGIMAKESSSAEQGVPSFEYNPATKRQPLLFELSRPIDELADDLLSRFAGQTLTMEQIYKQHNVGTRYIKKNYKDVLKQMEATGQIQTEPSANARKRNTFADWVKVIFPLR